VSVNVDGLAILCAGSADPTVAPGRMAPMGSLYLRTNGSQYVKTTNADTGWLLSSVGAVQRFTYTVTGAEPDLTALVIALPANRATNTYQVYWSQDQATNVLGAAVLTASKTVAQFVLTLTGAATAGDIFNFMVVDGT
jgi:hypothetical protein